MNQEEEETEARLLRYNRPYSRSSSRATQFVENEEAGGGILLHKSSSLDLSAWTEEVSSSGMYNDNSSFDESKCASASSDDDDCGGRVEDLLFDVNAAALLGDQQIGEKGTTDARLYYPRQELHHHHHHQRIYQHGGTTISHASSHHRVAVQVDVTATIALWDDGVVMPHHSRGAAPYAPSPTPPLPTGRHLLLGDDDDAVGGAHASSDGGSERTPATSCPSDEELSNRGKSAPHSLLKEAPTEDTEGPTSSGSSSSEEGEIPPEEGRPRDGDNDKPEGDDCDYEDEDDDGLRAQLLRNHSMGHLSTVSSLSDGEHLKLSAFASHSRDFLLDGAAEKSTVAIGNRRCDEWDCAIHDNDDAASYPSTGANSTSVGPSRPNDDTGETIEILAPPGKLGIVIDTPDGELPVVHTVKKGSALAGLVRVGDRLLAVDDEDVCLWTAVDISRLLAGKSASLIRRLTLLREPQHLPGRCQGGGANGGDDAFAQLGNSDRLLLDAALLLTENGAGDDDLILCALSQSLAALGGVPTPSRAEGSQSPTTSPSRSSKSDDIVVIPPTATTIPPATVLSPTKDDEPTLKEGKDDGAPVRHGRGRRRDRNATAKTLPVEIKVATKQDQESASEKGTPTSSDQTQRRKRRKKKRRFPKERLEV